MMIKRTLSLAVAASIALGLSGSAPAAAIGGAGPRPTISIADMIERVDRQAILANTKILGVVQCREGNKWRTVLWIENPWVYGYVESTPERGDQWCTVEGFAEMFHAGGCPERETTVYTGGEHAVIALHRASTYTFAPLPSWLGLGDDRRVNNWAFPEPERAAGRLGLAHDSGFMDPSWTDPEMARMLQPVDPEADAFAECFRNPDKIKCFGKWGPQDGRYPRTGWMPDGSRRSRLLAMLYSAQLAREGPEGYRTGWQENPRSHGRGHTYYRLAPRDTGPETGHFVQLIYPKREDAMKIGSSEVFEGEKRAPPAMGALLYGIFRRPAEPGAPCDSVRFMQPREVD